MILSNLDLECKLARDRLSRKLGQRVRRAKEAQDLRYQQAVAFIDELCLVLTHSLPNRDDPRLIDAYIEERRP
jgi:hypothetical protein